MNANEATLVIADEYSRMAETYDKLVAPRFEPIARTVAEALDPRPGELVLDVATGTGILACLLAPKVVPAQLVAIDLADEALGVASFRAGGAGIRNIRFEMMDARNIIYRGRLFDKVGSNLGMPNLGWDRAFHEVHRVLKPGGRFVYSEWAATPSTGDGLYGELLPKYRMTLPSAELARIREAVQVNRGPEVQQLKDPAAVRRALESVGFVDVQDLARTFVTHFAGIGDFLAFEGAWGWDERELREMPPENRRAFEAEIAQRLGDRLDPQGFDDVWKIHITSARVPE